MNITPEDCNVKILVYVDTTQVKASSDSDQGVYMLDNRGRHSQGAGSANLDTSCSLNDFVCWEVRAMDYQIGDSAKIVGFRQSPVWRGHKPRRYDGPEQEGKPDHPKPVASWITRASKPGTFPYGFTVDVVDFDGQLKTAEVTHARLSVGN